MRDRLSAVIQDLATQLADEKKRADDNFASYERVKAEASPQDPRPNGCTRKSIEWR
jgi:hypothetical protein